MEAAGSERAVLMGVSEGGPLCSAVCRHLSAAHRSARHDRQLRAPPAGRTTIPGAPTREERDRFCQTILDEWGGPVGIEERAPSRASDPAFREWWASYLRMGASPGAAVALTRMNAEIDIRGVLPSIRVPTLVLHRTGDRCLKVEEGRYLASRIPGADVRRAARRRSPAVCRRSGRDSLGDRAVPEADPLNQRFRSSNGPWYNASIDSAISGAICPRSAPRNRRRLRQIR